MANMLVVYGPPDEGHIDHNWAKRSSNLCDIALMLGIIDSDKLIRTMMASYCSDAEKTSECARVRALLVPGRVEMTLHSRTAWNELLNNGTEDEINRAIKQASGGSNSAGASSQSSTPASLISEDQLFPPRRLQYCKAHPWATRNNRVVLGRYIREHVGTPVRKFCIAEGTSVST